MQNEQNVTQTQGQDNNVPAVFEEKEEIATPSFIQGLQGNSTNEYYCSIENDGKRETQILMYNALNNCDTPLVPNMVNLVLELVDVAAYTVPLIDADGIITEGIRCILICKDGTSYFATSQGVLNSLRKMFMIVGMPDGGAWHKNPVKVKVLQKPVRSSATNKVTVLEMVK